MKKLFLYVVMLLVAPVITAQPVLKTMKRLPDTGENTSYTSTFGEDNDYTINAPFFSILPCCSAIVKSNFSIPQTIA